MRGTYFVNTLGYTGSTGDTGSPSRFIPPVDVLAVIPDDGPGLLYWRYTQY